MILNLRDPCSSSLCSTGHNYIHVIVTISNATITMSVIIRSIICIETFIIFNDIPFIIVNIATGGSWLP